MSSLYMLIFLRFVFIMGTSIKLSQVSLYSRGVKRRKIFLKILTRTLILFGLGLILDGKFWKLSQGKCRSPLVLKQQSKFEEEKSSRFHIPLKHQRKFRSTLPKFNIWIYCSQYGIIDKFLGIVLNIPLIMHWYSILKF